MEILGHSGGIFEGRSTGNENLKLMISSTTFPKTIFLDVLHFGIKIAKYFTLRGRIGLFATVSLEMGA